MVALQYAIEGQKTTKPLRFTIAIRNTRLCKVQHSQFQKTFSEKRERLPPLIFPQEKL